MPSSICRRRSAPWLSVVLDQQAVVLVNALHVRPIDGLVGGVADPDVSIWVAAVAGV